MTSDTSDMSNIDLSISPDSDQESNHPNPNPNPTANPNPNPNPRSDDINDPHPDLAVITWWMQYEKDGYELDWLNYDHDITRVTSTLDNGHIQISSEKLQCKDELAKNASIVISPAQFKMKNPKPPKGFISFVMVWLIIILNKIKRFWGYNIKDFSARPKMSLTQKKYEFKRDCIDALSKAVEKKSDRGNVQIYDPKQLRNIQKLIIAIITGSLKAARSDAQQWLIKHNYINEKLSTIKGIDHFDPYVMEYCYKRREKERARNNIIKTATWMVKLLETEMGKVHKDLVKADKGKASSRKCRFIMMTMNNPTSDPEFIRIVSDKERTLEQKIQTLGKIKNIRLFLDAYVKMDVREKEKTKKEARMKYIHFKNLQKGMLEKDLKDADAAIKRYAKQKSAVRVLCQQHASNSTYVQSKYGQPDQLYNGSWDVDGDDIDPEGKLLTDQEKDFIRFMMNCGIIQYFFLSYENRSQIKAMWDYFSKTEYLDWTKGYFKPSLQWLKDVIQHAFEQGLTWKHPDEIPEFLNWWSPENNNRQAKTFFIKVQEYLKQCGIEELETIQTKTPHYQIFAQLNYKMSWDEVHKVFQSVGYSPHIEDMYSNVEACMNYINKEDGNYKFEWGNLELSQAKFNMQMLCRQIKRGQYHNVNQIIHEQGYQALKNGKVLRQLFGLQRDKLNHENNVFRLLQFRPRDYQLQFILFALSVRKTDECPLSFEYDYNPRWSRNITWFFGDSGCGKTFISRILTTFCGAISITPNNGWKAQDTWYAWDTNNTAIIVIDISMLNEVSLDFYNFLENCQNDSVLISKYESRFCEKPNLKIVVLSNKPPLIWLYEDKKAIKKTMSLDRFEVVKAIKQNNGSYKLELLDADLPNPVDQARHPDFRLSMENKFRWCVEQQEFRNNWGIVIGEPYGSGNLSPVQFSAIKRFRNKRFTNAGTHAKILTRNEQPGSGFIRAIQRSMRELYCAMWPKMSKQGKLNKTVVPYTEILEMQSLDNVSGKVAYKNIGATVASQFKFPWQTYKTGPKSMRYCITEKTNNQRMFLEELAKKHKQTPKKTQALQEIEQVVDYVTHNRVPTQELDRLIMKERKKLKKDNGKNIVLVPDTQDQIEEEENELISIEQMTIEAEVEQLKDEIRAEKPNPDYLFPTDDPDEFELTLQEKWLIDLDEILQQPNKDVQKALLKEFKKERERIKNKEERTRQQREEDARLEQQSGYTEGMANYWPGHSTIMEEY